MTSGIKRVLLLSEVGLVIVSFIVRPLVVHQLPSPWLLPNSVLKTTLILAVFYGMALTSILMLFLLGNYGMTLSREQVLMLDMRFGSTVTCGALIF